MLDFMQCVTVECNACGESIEVEITDINYDNNVFTVNVEKEELLGWIIESKEEARCPTCDELYDKETNRD